ncbi:hypothetical protein GCM10028862_19280 [Luteimonas pelagia]
MSFAKLQRKVEQAESTLEAQERRMSADWRQLKRSWRAAWTPGRIVVAGLATGYLVGRTEPLQKATNAAITVIRLLASVMALKASEQAEEAAHEAEDAAHEAEETVTGGPVEAARDDVARQPTATAEAYEP